MIFDWPKRLYYRYWMCREQNKCVREEPNFPDPGDRFTEWGDDLYER